MLWPPWSCLCLVSESASLFFSLGCCVRLPGLVFVLSPSLLACSSAWDAVSGSLVLSPNLCPSLPACSSAWDAVSGSLVLSLSCLRSCLPVSQLVFQPGCCVRLPGLVFVLSPSLLACSSAWDAVSASLVLSLFCLPVC